MLARADSGEFIIAHYNVAGRSKADGAFAPWLNLGNPLLTKRVAVAKFERLFITGSSGGYSQLNSYCLLCKSSTCHLYLKRHSFGLIRDNVSTLAHEIWYWAPCWFNSLVAVRFTRVVLHRIWDSAARQMPDPSPLREGSSISKHCSILF